MPSWKLWLRRGVAVFVLLIVVIASLLAGLLLPYFLAEWSAKIWFLAVSSVCAFAVVAWAGAWLCALIWRAEGRRKFAGTFSALCSTVFLIALYALILRPNPSGLTETIRPDNTRYWQLSTGSRIAYSEYDPPAGMPVKPEAILFSSWRSGDAHRSLGSTVCVNIKCGVQPSFCWPYLQRMLTKNPHPLEAAAQDAISLAETVRNSER